MKRSILLLFISEVSVSGALACPVCKENQPEVLKNITHGPGPQNDWDYIITWSAVVIVAITLFFSIKFLVKPGEKNIRHIKNIILSKD